MNYATRLETDSASLNAIASRLNLMKLDDDLSTLAAERLERAADCIDSALDHLRQAANLIGQGK